MVAESGFTMTAKVMERSEHNFHAGIDPERPSLILAARENL
jgi:hypothetical protein